MKGGQEVQVRAARCCGASEWLGRWCSRARRSELTDPNVTSSVFCQAYARPCCLLIVGTSEPLAPAT